MFLLTPLLLVLHARVRISPTTVLGLLLLLLLLSAILLLLLLLLLLLWMVLVLIVLLLLLLRIAVSNPIIVVAVRGHHVVGIIHIGSTAATSGGSVSNCGVRMLGIRISLQLYSSSTPKIGIRLFLLPIAVGGLAPGCGGGSRLLLVAVAVASLSTIVRRH